MYNNINCQDYIRYIINYQERTRTITLESIHGQGKGA
uniref:Uncharacterized protein n=1 Tax=Arundo donax TaxID=35708 RepID=A0A0A9EN33_ARUDO